MAFLPEDQNWDAGIYQIETTDPVLGGPNGISNKPLKNLANRTLHLKGRVENLEASKAPLASPGLTGTPTAPTAAAGDNSNKLATTAFVQAAASTKLNIADIGNYAPTKAGGGAYGNWSINISGNAASASAVPWGGVTGRPTDLGSFTNGPGYVTDAPTKAGGGAYGTWGININGLASAVADAGSSKAQNGYIKVPGSNLIIQWGRIAIGDPGLDYFGSISFPIAFPNQIFQVNATPYSYAGTAFDISVGVTAHSLTGFNFTVQEWNNITQNIEVSYIAIGY